MKYKVVKEGEDDFPCIGCVLEFKTTLNYDACAEFIKENNLPDCIQENCHFELADEITDVDLREIDNTPTNG
jgi:hypothetical protein